MKVTIVDNPIDIFIKPVPRGKFRHCLDLLNILSFNFGP